MVRKKSKPPSTHVRGVLLEEVVLHLLKIVGYRVIDVKSKAEGTRKGKSGLEVIGRGEKHQIDALAAFDYTPAFMYPLRLIVEAKCYKRSSPIKIDIVRNSVGVLKDINENYFSTKLHNPSSEIKLQRFPSSFLMI